VPDYKKTTDNPTNQMENQRNQAQQKLTMVMKHAPMGLAEIDNAGMITHLNTKGEALLKPVLIANGISGNNLYPVLEHIAPSVIGKIKSSSDDAGHILTNETHKFFLSFGGEKIERQFNFTVIKMFTDCIIIGFDDLTQRTQKELAIQQLLSDKAVIQGKFEIASNILHDIGNGVVGFGSYISRIKRSLEQNNPDNFQKLVDFLSMQQASLAATIGEAKAEALIKMLAGICETQRNTHTEIAKSVSEQLNIITHIQDILNIQRQYVSGNETQEQKPINLRGIIQDCMSMLFASIEKRAIKIYVEIPETLPIIKGDRTRLMQVILNLLKNSIEAIDISGPEKKIWLNLSSGEATVTLRIKDTGHGFDPETGIKLFERGFTTKASGSGLGLHHCKTIIENHEGAISITSDGFGKGALTTLEFKI
jgi:signal transduction histidine kinase